MNLQLAFSKTIEALKNKQIQTPSDQAGFPKGIILDILDHSGFSLDIRKRLEEEFLGCGPLYSLVEEPLITEIILDGSQCIFFEKKGQLYKHEDIFLSSWTFDNFIHKILAQSKQVLTLQKPYVNGRWNQFRFHIIIPPLTPSHTHITMRKHPLQSWTFDELGQVEWAPAHAIKLIKDALDARMNMLICGSTSSGKTSILNACLGALAPTERVISIEDTDELIQANPFSVKLLTRTETDHLASIDQSVLVKQSLRMRPDRIVMGEVRGREAKDLIMALSTGHQGSIGTIHAHSYKQALIRLELLVKGYTSWSSTSIQNLIHLGLELIIMVDKVDKKRKLKGIYQITGLESTGFLFETLFHRDSKVAQPLLTNDRWGLGHQTTSL